MACTVPYIARDFRFRGNAGLRLRQTRRSNLSVRFGEAWPARVGCRRADPQMRNGSLSSRFVFYEFAVESQ